MKFNPAMPIYLQIMDSIKQEIVTGTLAPGDRVDSVRNLAQKYGVNLNTMQRACSELEREAVIQTQRGVGSFVTEDASIINTLKLEMSQAYLKEFIQGMQGLGYENDEILNLLSEAMEK
jgi:GntR family transcriptional regulator